MCGFPARLAKTITVQQGSLWQQFSTHQPITIVNSENEYTISQCPVKVVCEGFYELGFVICEWVYKYNYILINEECIEQHAYQY